MPRSASPRAVWRRWAAETAVVALGVALLVGAAAADARWLDRHVLPDFYAPRSEQLLVLSVLRILGATLALALILVVRPRLGRWATRTSTRRFVLDAAPIGLAVVLALAASELMLSRLPWRAAQETPSTREPLRQRDPRLGWVFRPARAGEGRLGGRTIGYAFDAAGHRVRRSGDRVDPARPTMLFTGESIMVGHGLAWEESIPAQVEALTGVQSANLAVEGYATDQAYLRLREDWPRFQRPVAVVALFMPSLLGRALDVDRPHLDPDLAWHGPTRTWRLAQVIRRAIPYRSDRDIDRGVAISRAALADTVAMARRRGATPLIVVPQLAPETAAERALRRRVLDDAGLPYVVVDLDPSWRIARNRHPDARAARVIAQAVARSLAAAPEARR